MMSFLELERLLQPQTDEQRRDRDLAILRIRSFERRYGMTALRLACHAAFPMALTAELVYCLRENFADLRADVPWYAAADVLLSGLCESIGHDLYEMSGAVRMELLQRLRREFGDQRILTLERLMGDYILVQLGLEREQAAALGRQSWDRSKILGDRPHWTTLCCLQPGKVREAIEQEVRRIWLSTDGDERERLHLSTMVESYGFLLPGEPILLQLADDVAMGEVPSGAWYDWAAQYGIKLVPQLVTVKYIEFGDEPTVPDTEPDPNVLQDFEFTVVTLDQYGDVATREQKWAKYFVEPLGDGVPPLELVAIPGGEFLMGSPMNEEDHQNDEEQHLVKVPPFFMGKYPVTNAQWRYVASELRVEERPLADPDPSLFKGDNCPVTNVSWLDAQEFCARVSNLTGRPCRLPTEAEWEYACRADTITPFHFGATISSQFVNYDGDYTYGNGRKGEYRNETIAVGSLGIANNFGLYDMHGNVWEWCEDHYNSSYQQTPQDGSAWIDSMAEESSSRILRGGSWFNIPNYCRSASRRRFIADFRNLNFGFRVVYSPART
jgi:formylglycine-generating enzyme required for sulfatase activity